MPTQEEINAAQVELDIANDNYARLANKYNSYLKVFDAYKNASPETQQRAQWVMQRMMNNFEDLKLNMYAAEDRIAVAQNRVNEINSIVPTVTTTAPARRRTVVPPTPTNDELRLNEYLNAWYVVWQDWLVHSPNWALVESNGYNINSKWQWTPIIKNPVFDNLTNQQYVDNYKNSQSQVSINPAIINTNSWIRWTISQAPAIPYEIQNVRNLRWNEYLQWLNDLQNNYWYNVIWQRAYRNWQSYRTY